jgi:hypothetical protein
VTQATTYELHHKVLADNSQLCQIYKEKVHETLIYEFSTAVIQNTTERKETITL